MSDPKFQSSSHEQHPQQRQQKYTWDWASVISGCLPIALGLSLTCLLWCSPLLLGSAVAQPSHQYLAQAAQQSELDGKQLAADRQFEAAVMQFEQAAKLYAEQGDAIGEAIALSNLASVHGQLGQWEDADRTIQRSLELLSWPNANSADANPAASLPSEHLQLVALVLDVRGRLWFDRDRLEDAYDTWQTSQALFDTAGDLASSIRIQIEQARVLQALGFYGRASDRLQVAVETLDAKLELDGDAHRRLQSSGLRQLGNALLLVGNASSAEQSLLRSLEIARELEDNEAIAASQLSLGNVARWVSNNDLALDYYTQAATSSRNPDVQLRAELNQLDILLKVERWSQLQQELPRLKRRIAELPLSRNTVLARTKLLATITQLRPQQPDIAPATEDILEWAATTRQQARDLGDRRAESQTLRLLGQIYEHSQQFDDAHTLTEEAIALAQAERNFDVAYRGQWQLGRILVAQNNHPAAINAYQSALVTLDSLRGDLAAVNPDAQFAFQDSIEPVHRQLVELLLEEQETESNTEPDGGSDRLDVARQTLERLQLAELDNFFRAACIDSIPVAIEDVDANAAVIYPIVLSNRLELLFHLPGEPLKHVSVDVASAELARTVDRTRLAFGQRTSPRYLPLAQQLYNWIVRPIAADLAASETDTLVFVPDGVLRNMPMGALHDGDRYLLERYAIAVSPGLELLPPAAIDIPDARILTAGLSQPRQGFTGLAHVIAELDKIDANLSGRSLRDREFTQQSLQKAMGDDQFSFVHIATHGQFSSQLDRTFLLAWDDTIDINQLRSFIVASDFSRDRPLDLLVLSACETAAGDRRAALGLAGIATRSGARSTVATLWKVSDEMTANIVDRFYQNLVVDGMTKAKALQQAQLAIYSEADAEQQHPFYWGSFVLVGNWQ